MFLCLFGSYLLSLRLVVMEGAGGGGRGSTQPLLQPLHPRILQPLHKEMHGSTLQKHPPKKKPNPPFSDVTLFPPALTVDTDSEEEEEGSLRDEWPAQPPSAPKPRPPGFYSAARKGGRAAGGPKAAPRSAAAGRPLKPKAAAGRKQPFCLLLREAEAGSSFSDSSEDSFDQGY